MTVINWTVKYKEGGAYTVQFWTKADKSNALEFKTVTLEAEKIRNKIESLTGTVNFTLNYIKPAGEFRPPPEIIRKH